MHNLLTKVFAFLGNLFLRFVCGSNKLSITRSDILDAYFGKGGNIFALWHSRLFYLAYRAIKVSGERKLTILVSMSRDGDYGTALAHKLGLDVVRGSSSRSGRAAIRSLAGKLSAGYNIVVTPDGPRGPAFEANQGVIRLAQLTGARIIPVSYDASRKRVLKSWDRFILPKCFGRVHMAFAEPTEVPRRAGPDKIEEHRKNLEHTLLELDGICEEKLSRHTV
ncbi:MAG: lysophospholipid acyltransferase family protein [Phycisphaerales bacterium]|nr:MAG: lysophospholipid acyltransferase family protein [Phycisphaerales bacterium]